MGEDDVDVAGGFDVSSGDAAIGVGLDVASVEGAYHLEGFVSEALEEIPVAGGVVGLGGFGHFLAIFMSGRGLKGVVAVRGWSLVAFRVWG